MVLLCIAMFNFTLISLLHLLRYQDDGNIAVEKVIVKEIRGNFGKKKWTKTEIKGMYRSYVYLYMYITCDVPVEN